MYCSKKRWTKHRSILWERGRERGRRGSAETELLQLMYLVSLVTKINWPKKEWGMLQQQPTLQHQLADWLRAWEKRTLVNQRHTRGATGRSWRGCTWNVKGTRGCSKESIQKHWSIGLCSAQHWHTETEKVQIPLCHMEAWIPVQTQIPVWLEAHRPVVMAGHAPSFLYCMIWVNYCKQ